MMVTPSKDHGSPGNREVTLEPDVHYVCQRCTACCKWPGDVRIEEDEIAPIAKFLGLTDQEFLDRFTRLRTNRQGLSLIEKDNHECIMLDGNACRIHPVKPEQCAGFPNKWNFPGWRQVCEAIPVPNGARDESGAPFSSWEMQFPAEAAGGADPLECRNF